MAAPRPLMDPIEPSISNPDFPVTFFLAGEPDVERLKCLDPDKDIQVNRKGEHSWVVQTYLRLRAAGYPVDLAGTPPQKGMVVFHAKQKHLLARAVNGNSDLIFVGIRADNSAPLLADFEILQNGWFVDGIRKFQVTFWPQPGIQPRDSRRGTRVERVGYMGMIENLAPDFRNDGWRRALAELGMSWDPSMVRFREMRDPAEVRWEHCREIDVMVAVRPQEPELAFAKPASKLINAWRAGIPALVGPEFQYRELQSNAEDFIEVRDVPEALDALKRLKGDPDLYRRMVSNGHRRALEYSESGIVQQWAELLFDTIPSRAGARGLHWTHRLPLALRLPVRRALRWIRMERSR